MAYLFRPMKALLTFVFCFYAAAADAAETSEERCREFLAHFPAVYRVSNGTSIAFTGRFTRIPVELAADLQREFPFETFHIAEMTWIHWGPEPVRLLIVDEHPLRLLRTYLFDVSFAEAPPSFGEVFDQRGQKPEVAKARLTVLARLLCFQMGWTAGEVTLENGVLFAPLINPQKDVWRIIRCPIEVTSRIEHLAFILPQDKDKEPGR